MTAALILAAGKSDGQLFDPTEEIRGISPIRRLISVFQQTGTERTVVVTGHNAEQIEHHCGRLDVIFLQNEAYETNDMLSSVKLGLGYLADKCERAFIAPVDVPFVTAETLIKMEAEASAHVAIPVYGADTGHPLLVSSRAFDTVLNYNGPDGINGLLSSENITRQFIDVSDKGIISNFRDKSKLDELLVSVPFPKIGAGVKVWLADDRSFFGPGAFRLLKLTEETGSLKTACRQVGVSYGKGRGIVMKIEERLGYPIIVTHTGGKNGGGSKITERCQELMRRYEAFMTDCNEQTLELFEKHFGDSEDLW